MLILLTHFCHVSPYGFVGKLSTYKGSNNFLTVTVHHLLPFYPPPLFSCLSLPPLWPTAFSSSKSVCGLSLDEQSYYEKSNPSLRDRGVTQDLDDTERPDVRLDTQIPSSRRMHMQMNRRKMCIPIIGCHILHLRGM